MLEAQKLQTGKGQTWEVKVEFEVLNWVGGGRQRQQVRVFRAEFVVDLSAGVENVHTRLIKQKTRYSPYMLCTPQVNGLLHIYENPLQSVHASARHR